MLSLKKRLEQDYLSATLNEVASLQDEHARCLADFKELLGQQLSTLGVERMCSPP